MGSFITAALSLGMFMLLPLSAGAQAFEPVSTSAIQPGLAVKRDGEPLKNAPLLFVNQADCDANAQYEFSVRYASAPNVVEAWVGANGVDCSIVQNRVLASTRALPPCKLVGRTAEPSLNPTLRVSAVDLFSADALSPDFVEEYGDLDLSGSEANPGQDAAACDVVVNRDYTLSVIPLPQPTNLVGNKGYDALSNVGYGALTATFRLFTRLPEPPTGVRARSGQTAIDVSFEPAPGAIASTEYKAYFDWGAGGEDCGSGTLLAGAEPPGESETIATVSTHAATATLEDLDTRAIPAGAQVAISLVTVDPAGNQSLLSAPVCSERLAPEQPDVCAPKSKCAGHSKSCSALPHAAAAPPQGAVALALGALTVTLLVRRKRS